MKCDALYIVGERKTEIRTVEVAEPGYSEVQIEVKGCGVCAWDSYLFKGQSLTQPFPFRFGHEAVGVIAKLGPGVEGFQVGDKVFCIEGPVGEMAQVINMPTNRIGKLPDVDDKELLYYVLEPVVCVVSGVNMIRPRPGDRVALIGTGYMGLLNTQAYAHSLIGELICFDIDDKRLALAKEFGADRCYNSLSEEGKHAIEEIISEGGVDISVECSGSQPGLTLATNLVKTTGTISNFAWHRGERTIDGTTWHMGGLSIINTSDAGDPHFPLQIQKTVQLVNRGVFDQKKLITHVMDYHDIQEMLITAESKSEGYIKGVITF